MAAATKTKKREGERGGKKRGRGAKKKGRMAQKKMLAVPLVTAMENEKKISMLLSASVKKFGVSRMRDFFLCKICQKCHYTVTVIARPTE